MIFYASDSEQWEDTEDPTFIVDMTPEGEADGFPEFATKAEFWKWYSNDPECPDFATLSAFQEWYFKR